MLVMQEKGEWPGEAGLFRAVDGLVPGVVMRVQQLVG